MLDMWKEDYPNDQEVTDFTSYFKAEHLDKEGGWYEGFSPNVVNNNGLESVNRVIKQGHLLRNKMKFEEFTGEAEKIVKHWSSAPQYQVVFL